MPGFSGTFGCVAPRFFCPKSNEAPDATLSTTSVTFSEATATAVSLFPSITLADSDDTTLSALIMLTDAKDGDVVEKTSADDDIELHSDGFGATISAVSKSDLATKLQKVGYKSTASYTDTLTRSIELVVSDNAAS